MRLRSKQTRSGCLGCPAETHLTPCQVSTWHRVWEVAHSRTSWLSGPSRSSQWGRPPLPHRWVFIGLTISTRYGSILAPRLHPVSCSSRSEHHLVGLSLYSTSSLPQYVVARCGFGLPQGAKPHVTPPAASHVYHYWAGRSVSRFSQNFSPGPYPTTLICPEDQ